MEILYYCNTHTKIVTYKSFTNFQLVQLLKSGEDREMGSRGGVAGKLFNNYLMKAKWILFNNSWDEINEVIQQYSTKQR